VLGLAAARAVSVAGVAAAERASARRPPVSTATAATVARAAWAVQAVPVSMVRRVSMESARVIPALMASRAAMAVPVASAVLVVWRVRPAGRRVRLVRRVLMVTVATAERPVTAARVVPVSMAQRE
jgi:hypothetical protein